MPSPMYQKVNNGNEDIDSETEPLSPTHHAPREKSSIWTMRILSVPGGFVLFNLIFFLFSILILLISIIHVQNITHNIDNSLLKKTSSYSPILDKLPISLRETRTHGNFFADDPPSLFQLPPSPEVDAAWDRISDTHAIVLSRDEILNMGRDPAEQWRFPEEYGYGDDAYMGLLDVFHHLHCLNAMRQAAYPEYYFNRTHDHSHHERSTPGQVHFTRGGHDLHCQYILLQFILCHADVGMVTFNKVEGVTGPMADFSIDHKCRDFGAILDWKEENQVNVSDEEWALIQRAPEGIRELSGEGRARPFGSG
ncbi:hypothetical protein P170DRAFT_438293 [Aspergillus steynii IBT 23096]|uniref:Tat pathway signal sequence n=1 Tax=Aspergillus steynii IBT 23096 TaxID=1392250 RepID=A0A2I2G0Z7_9EURO|nr:uncharacterized protein P170DRAFT_438293 [Aspergillus steynii IBT 23096]PLB46541.1 hypothetical protein P170DRAFT_438293 [Aspergillus steynii IBT 23096]